MASPSMPPIVEFSSYVTRMAAQPCNLESEREDTCCISDTLVPGRQTGVGPPRMVETVRDGQDVNYCGIASMVTSINFPTW